MANRSGMQQQQLLAVFRRFFFPIRWWGPAAARVYYTERHTAAAAAAANPQLFRAAGHKRTRRKQCLPVRPSVRPRPPRRVSVVCARRVPLCLCLCVFYFSSFFYLCARAFRLLRGGLSHTHTPLVVQSALRTPLALDGKNTGTSTGHVSLR